jgi:hypothetical protein
LRNRRHGHLRNHARRDLGPGLTLKLYSVKSSDGTPATDQLLLTKDQTFALPYRPSRDAIGNCPASGFYPWWSDAEKHCYSGMAHAVTFALPGGVTLPDQLIWSISFNTQTHGYVPVGADGPWNSLNVGAETFPSQPAVGTDVQPAGVFLNSSWTGAYGDKGAGGTGTFRDDPTGWADNAPLVCFGTCPIDYAAASPTPIESVEGATSGPRHTPPPTSEGDSAKPGPAPLLAIFTCFASGALGLAAVRTRRRMVGR